jgi:CPA1 family monovalent cation:H+ antiporter
MTIAARFELLLVLLAVVVVLELLARRTRLPPAGALILGGIALALIPGTPEVELDPDLALVLFLPPLLQGSAYFTVWRDFRADLRIILQLAVGAVAFTTAIVGVVTHLVMPGMGWAACFALGAIVSPPDAVAAKAVLQYVTLPQRVVTLLEGESLVNDASGLVLYRFAVAAALTGTFSAGHAALSFVTLAIGGCVAGAAFGYLVTLALARLPDATLSITVSFLAAWGAYIGGEALHVSGVLATVACGLVMGTRQHAVLGAGTRVQARAVWGFTIFILESLVFILIGLSLRHIVHRLGGRAETIMPLLPAIGAIVAAVILSRFAWMIPATYLPRALVPALRRRDPYPPIGIPIVMSWAGMRGVVSLAAALALPADFPQRDFILTATFAVILVTVLVQGVTLAPLVRLVRIGSFRQTRADTLDEAAARARVAAAQLAAVQKHASHPDGTVRHPRLLEQYNYRAKAASRFSEAHGELAPHREEHFGVILAAIAAGRAELLRLHRTGHIHDAVLHALENELDLEELSATRRRGAAETFPEKSR